MIELIIEVEDEEYRKQALKHDNVHQWSYSESMLRIDDADGFSTLKTGALRVKLADERLEIPSHPQIADPPVTVLSATEYESDD